MDAKTSSDVSPLILRTCTEMLTWDALVDDSPQGHVFSTSAFLQSLGAPYICHLVTTPKGEVLAGAVILKEGNRMARAPFAFTPHQGILFARSVAQQPSQKRMTTEFRITTFMIEALLDAYPNFSMAMSPFFKDLRPFLWHNYSLEGNRKFDVKHRYTGHLHLQSFELASFLTTVRALRRREYKKNQVRIQQTADLPLFLSLYQKTYSRQGLSIDANLLGLVQRICEQAMAKGYGYLSSASLGDRTASMAFFVSDIRCVYYLFGANDPEMRHAHASSKLLIDNIALSAQRGLQRFDFVGVNSPQRGDFKLSFNADLVPYQEVHLEANA